MKLVILDTSADVSEWAAKYVVKRITDYQPGPERFYYILVFDSLIFNNVFFRYFVLGLPTGSTPLGMYRKLIEYHNDGRVSFKYVKTFNMDEYVGK